MAQKIVIKYGGVALQANDFNEIRQMREQGFQPILVHGGGKELSELSLKLGIEPVFKNGLRVTDDATMDVVQMVLMGRVNTRLVATLRSQGFKAVGVSGLADASSLQADLGHVGKMEDVDANLLNRLCDEGYIPVMAPIAMGEEGTLFNVNGDSFAACVAVATHANKLLLMTDVDGVYLDPKKKETRFDRLSIDEIRKLKVQDGMIPKLTAAVEAIEQGVESVLIGKSMELNTQVTRKPSSAFEHLAYQEHKHLFQNYARYPVALERGLGSKVWDRDGKEYLDLLAGIAVLPLGHCHPEVVDAICQQSKMLMHTSNLVYSAPMVDLARCLTEMGDFSKVFFCNSGTEANEGAIKLARKYQWRKGLRNKFGIVSLHGSFHGRTYGALATSDKPALKDGFAPFPEGFSVAEWNDIESLHKMIGENTAAFIMEPVQGEGGIHLPSVEFLREARRLCDQYGALLIFDEVQCGLGRIGTFYAYQSFGVQPDVVTLAKGLGNGLPIGAICATETVAQAFKPGDHGTTFGGNLVCAAAALATLKVIAREDCCAKVRSLGKLFREGLEGLQRSFPDAIREVRGLGLMIGVELSCDPQQLHARCLEEGLLVNITAKNVLRLLPSYLITESEIQHALDTLHTCLSLN